MTTECHQIEGTDGVAFFADSQGSEDRVDAWHGLGQSVGRAMNAEEVMDLSKLGGWNVRKLPLTVPVPGKKSIPVPDKFATVRTNPINGETDYLGTVGTSYQPIQNEESTALLNALVDESGAHFETAGSLFNGRQTFVTMKLPEAMVLDAPGGRDTTDLYLAAMNSHDGTSSFRMMVTPVRVVCRNTQIAAIRSAQSSWSIRHTSGAKFAMQEARRSLGLTFKYVAAFEEEAKRMIEAQIEYDAAKDLLDSVFLVDEADSDRKLKVRMDHVENCLDFMNAATNANIAGTKFAVYNSVTEYVDHGWKVRGKGDQLGVSPEYALRGQFADLKSRAFELLTVG